MAGDIAQSLLNQANQNGGVWDRWTHASGGTDVMTGDPSHRHLPASTRSAAPTSTPATRSTRW